MLTVRPPVQPRAARAHALKNCLAVIYAVNQLIENEVVGPSLNRLERAQNAVRRMVELIDQDLVAESGACHPATKRAYVSASEIMDTVVARVQDRAEAGQVELFIRSGLGGICGDRDGLVEAFANIALNAIEATPAGGAVMLASCENADGAQYWTIRDMGLGIPKELMAELATPFHSRRAGGSGLGLAVARGIVEEHGGLTRIESALGAGTMISIWLPRSYER